MAKKKPAPASKPKTAKASKQQRDEKGHFLPGNTEGNRFEPGQSGNPAGRPKAKTLSEAYRAALERDANDETDRTNAEVIADKVIEMAKIGALDYIGELADRTEGKAKQTITGEGGEPLFKAYIGIDTDKV